MALPNKWIYRKRLLKSASFFDDTPYTMKYMHEKNMRLETSGYGKSKKIFNWVI